MFRLVQISLKIALSLVFKFQFFGAPWKYPPTHLHSAGITPATCFESLVNSRHIRKKMARHFFPNFGKFKRFPKILFEAPKGALKMFRGYKTSPKCHNFYCLQYLNFIFLLSLCILLSPSTAIELRHCHKCKQTATLVPGQPSNHRRKRYLDFFQQGTNYKSSELFFGRQTKAKTNKKRRRTIRRRKIKTKN